MTGELSDNLIEHEDAVGRLCNVLNSGGRHGITLARAHLDAFADATDDGVRAGVFTIGDAATVFALEHGFPSWPALRVHVFRLGRKGEEDPLQTATEAIHAGDASVLERQLQENPDLIAIERDSLLGTAVGCREVELVRLLLDAGANVDARYPCGCSPIHRAAYGHPPEPNPGAQSDHLRILDLLMAAGADCSRSSHGDGGTPLAMALFWGHSVLTERVAAEGIEPLNLRSAAGLGRTDLLEKLFERERLLPEAGAGREFYRPHDDFPEWQPSNDPEEILDEGFVWAARNGRIDAAHLLLERGAAIDGAPYNGTALHATAAKGPPQMLRWLLERGANPNTTAGTPEGSTPLHLAAVSGRLGSVRDLVEHGADREIQDQAFGSTPFGYAEWGGNQDVMEYLESTRGDR